MTLPRHILVALALFTALVTLPAVSPAQARPPVAPQPEVIQLAQEGEAPPRELQPRYEPVPPPEKSWYNDSYIFAMTRGVSDSTMVPAAKAPLYLLTVPLDLVLLPFAAIGGLFG